MAPEILWGEGYSRSCDYWSVGIILYEMLVGYPPFFANSQREIRQKITEWRKYVRVPDDVDISHEARDLLNCLLCEQSERICTLADAVAHPWFEGVDFKTLRKRRAPMVPQLKDPADTSYFDDFEEEERDAAAAAASTAASSDIRVDPRTLKRFYANDAPFFGFTYRNFRGGI